MEREIKSGFLYGAAGILLILAWLTWFLETPSVLWGVQVVGWVIGAIGLVLIFWPMFVLRRKGKPEEGKDWTQTSVLVDRGIYAVVRHPLYLGWSLMYVAVMAVGQHCLAVVFGFLGMACVYLISRQEDVDLVARFGSAYQEYMQSVPAMNLLAGILRLLRRRAEKGRGDE
jgi:protein-S-isoprenylcysteine O-methyltransferase Ste14